MLRGWSRAREPPEIHREAASNDSLFSALGEAVKTAQSRQSRVPAAGSLDCPDRAANDTEKRETKLVETNHILPQPPRANRNRFRYSRDLMDKMRWVKKEIQENIDYDGLACDYPCDSDLFDGYTDLMTEVCCATNETVHICGQELPTAVVRKRFLSLNREHILYVRDCVSGTTSRIGNIKAYILAALYNAPATMDQYYASMVSRDMAV